MKIVSLKGFVTGEGCTVFGLEVAEDEKIILFNPEQINTIAEVDNLLSLSVRTMVNNIDSIESLGENLKPEKIFQGLKELKAYNNNEDYVPESSDSASEEQIGNYLEDMGMYNDDGSLGEYATSQVSAGTDCKCKGCDCKKTPDFKKKPGKFKKPPKGPGFSPAAFDGNEAESPIVGN